MSASVIEGALYNFIVFFGGVTVVGAGWWLGVCRVGWRDLA